MGAFEILEPVSTRDELSNDASKVERAAGLASTGVKAARRIAAKRAAAGAAAKGAEAAGAAGGVAVLPAVGIAILCIIVLLAIFGVMQLSPSLSTNALLHTNDPEQLAGGEDIFSFEDENKELQIYQEKAEDAKEMAVTILEDAYAKTVKNLKTKAWWKGWEIKEEDILPPPSLKDDDPTAIVSRTKEHVVMLFSAYSASMHNGLANEAYEYYSDGIFKEGTNALRDFDKKLSKIIKKKNPDKENKPYGNYFYGADFERDPDGNVIVTEEIEEKEAQYDEYGNEIQKAETIIHKYVTPVIYDVDLQLVCEKAFEFRFYDIYEIILDEEDEDAKKALEEFNSLPDEERAIQNKGRDDRYCDVIIPMTSVAGEILFGESWMYSNPFKVEDYENFKVEHSDDDLTMEDLYPGYGGLTPDGGGWPDSGTGEPGDGSASGGKPGTVIPNPYEGQGNLSLVYVAENELKRFNAGETSSSYYIQDYFGAPHKWIDWCGIFVSYCTKQAGIRNDVNSSSPVPKYMGCGTAQTEFKNLGNPWVMVCDSNNNVIRIPGPGDIVFFETGKTKPNSSEQNHIADHTGIVVAVNKDAQGNVVSIDTIEGNVDKDKVRRYTWSIGHFSKWQTINQGYWPGIVAFAQTGQ